MQERLKFMFNLYQSLGDTSKNQNEAENLQIPTFSICQNRNIIAVDNKDQIIFQFEQKDKYQKQQQNIESNLTQQYSKALKELQENLKLASSN
ncbi:unnamed protein product [Paramecium primaurelia]|uniref:Uncharacterized protein n=1 Tax=Paramecium primaurelia TaxID=5886 RepID=A0A8S1NX33_PARPR|nr:unnamed protein product [Paramecium primaurelia]